MIYFKKLRCFQTSEQHATKQLWRVQSTAVVSVGGQMLTEIKLCLTIGSWTSPASRRTTSAAMRCAVTTTGKTTCGRQILLCVKEPAIQVDLAICCFGFLWDTDSTDYVFNIQVKSKNNICEQTIQNSPSGKCCLYYTVPAEGCVCGQNVWSLIRSSVCPSVCRPWNVRLCTANKWLYLKAPVFAHIWKLTSYLRSQISS